MLTDCAFCGSPSDDFYVYAGQIAECRDCHERRIARETREGIDMGDDMPVPVPKRSRIIESW